MIRKHVQFKAQTVECSEALDWEIMRVSLDSREGDFDEADRTSPYLSASVNYEFGRKAGIEFHDGADYNGGDLKTLDLWRTKVVAILKGGLEFEIDFEISDLSFNELRYYLQVMLPKARFRDHCLAQQGAAEQPLPAPGSSDDFP